MNMFRNLYFRFYQLMVDVGNRDIGSFASTLFMTMIFGVNIFTLIEILDLLGIGVNHISKSVAIGVMAFIFVSLYFSLVYNGKSAAIVNLYAGESKKDKLKGRLGLIAYIVLSILLLVSTWIFFAFRNRG